MIWLSSDLHLGHDREFVWKKRGFTSCEEMNTYILENLKMCVKPEDDLYILGDLTLGPHDAGMEMVKQIPGRVHVIIGNHDTDARIEKYKELPNIVEIVHATRFNYKKYHFYLSHYPTMTYNLDGADNLKTVLINLHGHTHATSSFYMDIPYVYNVGVDAHHCMPMSIDEVLVDIKSEWLLCKTMADGDEPFKASVPTLNPESEPKKEEPPQQCDLWDEGFCMGQKGMPEVWCDGHKEKCECKTQEEKLPKYEAADTIPNTASVEEREWLRKKYYNRFCDKCVGCSNTPVPCPTIKRTEYNEIYIGCPSGEYYRWDPPDGGYCG